MTLVDLVLWPGSQRWNDYRASGGSVSLSHAYWDAIIAAYNATPTGKKWAAWVAGKTQSYSEGSWNWDTPDIVQNASITPYDDQNGGYLWAQAWDTNATFDLDGLGTVRYSPLVDSGQSALANYRDIGSGFAWTQLFNKGSYLMVEPGYGAHSSGGFFGDMTAFLTDPEMLKFAAMAVGTVVGINAAIGALGGATAASSAEVAGAGALDTSAVGGLDLGAGGIGGFYDLSVVDGATAMSTGAASVGADYAVGGLDLGEGGIGNFADLSSIDGATATATSGVSLTPSLPSGVSSGASSSVIDQATVAAAKAAAGAVASSAIKSAVTGALNKPGSSAPEQNIIVTDGGAPVSTITKSTVGIAVGLGMLAILALSGGG